jgi:type IV secretion system protein VirD4
MTQALLTEHHPTSSSRDRREEESEERNEEEVSPWKGIEDDSDPSLRSRSSRRQTHSGTIRERLLWQGLWIGLVCVGWNVSLVRTGIIIILVLRLLSIRATTGSFNFGSARFAEQEDLQRKGLLKERGLILGRALPERPGLLKSIFQLFTAPWKNSREVNLRMRAALLGRGMGATPLIRTREYVHLMTISPPGGGKTTSQVIPNLLVHPGSCMVVDPKGELFCATAKVRQKRHQNQVVRLDPMRVCGADGARFNPLDWINPDSYEASNQCAALAEALVVETGMEPDPHWNACAKLGLTAAILYVVTYAPAKEKNLLTVLELLTDPQALEGMIGLLQDPTGELEKTTSHPNAYRALRRYGNMLSSWKEKELCSILTTIARQLVWMNSPLIEYHLSRSSFDPRNLIRQKMTIYLVLPPKHLAPLNRLLRLWITALYETITELGPQEERTVLMLLDEIGNVGSMPALYNAITMRRGYGIRVWLFLQSLNQLQSLFPKNGEHQAIEAAMETRIFFSIRDYKTAEELSNYMGTATIQSQSHTRSEGGSQTGSWLESMASNNQNFSRTKNWGTSVTISEMGRKLLFPDEILCLSGEIAIILTKGLPPIQAQLTRYYQTPELAELLQANRPTRTMKEENQ